MVAGESIGRRLGCWHCGCSDGGGGVVGGVVGGPMVAETCCGVRRIGFYNRRSSDVVYIFGTPGSFPVRTFSI